MLKHQNVISRLTPEQRLKLVISSQFLKRDRIDEFDFKSISVEQNPFSGRSGYSTYFPQFKALASTWNTKLIQLTGKYSAIENNSLLNGKVFDLTFTNQNTRATEDCFYNGKFINNFIKGINEGNGLSCVSLNTDPCENFENKIAPFNYAIQQNPSIVLVGSLDDVKYLKTQANYKNYIFAKASTKELAISLLQNGACLAFVDDEIFDQTISHGLVALNTFNKAQLDLNNGSIDYAEFNAICESGNAISEERLDEICDQLIDILFDIDNAHTNSAVEPLMKYYQKEHKVLFDEILHNNLAYESAKQSVILLKNQNVLPVSRNKKVCVIGDYVKNDNYVKAMSGRGDTIVDLVFDRINDYEELDTIGYVHGYLKGMSSNIDGYSKEAQIDEELIRKAKKLTQQSDVALVFLAPEKGEKALPECQLKLISSLSETGKEVIAVVVADNLIDLSFASLCSGLIFAYNGGQNLNKALLDVISGRISPSGKMVESSLEESSNNIPAYSTNNVEFPFGFGLSYTKFAYSNPEVNSAGVSVTVENVGNYDGYETVQLYVNKQGSKRSLASKHLKGFVKVFVEKGQKQRVFIPFDDNTFNVYNAEQACFMIEGGSYTLTIGDSSVNEKIVSSIKVKRYLNKVLFKNRVIAHDEEKMVDAQIGKVAQSADHQAIIKKNLFLTPGNKIALSLFFLIYVNLLSGLLLFSHFRTLSSFVIDKFSIIVGSIDAGLSLIFLICFIVFLCRRKKRKYAPVTLVNDTLTQVIDRVGLFHQESKTTYMEEVVPEEPSTEPEEEIVEEQPEEMETLSFALENNEETVELNNAYSLGDLYNKFTWFIQSKGLSVEPFAVRSILSSILTTNIVFINSQNKENLRKLVLAIQEFFACETDILDVQSYFDSVKNLLIRETNGEKTLTNFAINLNKASSSNQFTLLALADVSVTNCADYLADFIRFNDNPTIQRSITIGDNIDIKLKKNCVLLVIPEEDNFTEIMPDYLRNSTISLNLAIRDSLEVVTNEYQPVPFSYDDLIDHVEQAKETCFIPEENWKHFDELEDIVYEKEKVTFGNKVTIFSERFSSVFMDCRGEDYEAVDALLAFKYLPILKSLSFYKQSTGDFELTNLLEKVFGKENLDKTLRYVKKVEKIEPVVFTETLAEDLEKEISEDQTYSENSEIVTQEENAVEVPSSEDVEQTEANEVEIQESEQQVLENEETVIAEETDKKDSQN